MEQESPPPRPVITPSMEEAINRARYGSADLVYFENQNSNITGKQMHNLKDGEWLDDEIINFTMKAIQERNETKGLRKIFCILTFFLPKLLQRGYDLSTRLLGKTNVFEYDLLIIPLNQRKKHWSLFAVDNIKKQISYYDSCLALYGTAESPPYTKCFKALQDFLEKEHLKQNGTKLETLYTTFTDRNVPQQDNGNDCGVFACQFVECLSRDAPFRLSLADIPYFRKKMAWEILIKKFYE